MTNTNAKLLTPKDVAEVLHIHRYTVYKLLDEGKLKGFRISNRWRIPENELERFMSVDYNEEDA